MDLEPNKENNDLELYLGDLMVYLHPEMDRVLKWKGLAIVIRCSVQVNYNNSWGKDVEQDEEKWFDRHDY